MPSGAGAGVVDGVVHQVGEAVVAVLDALPAGGGGAHPEVGAEDGLEPARAAELHDLGPAVGSYGDLLSPPAPLTQGGLEVRLKLREGLALSLGAVHRVGDVAQDVEAGGLGDAEHLGVRFTLELEPGPGGQRPGASAPEVADRVARRQAEGLDVRGHLDGTLPRQVGEMPAWRGE